MNKDFSKTKLLSFNQVKQIRILFDLAKYIETKRCEINSNHFLKLAKYHAFLNESEFENIQKLNKEFSKVKALDYQFQVYLMNLERLLGQSTKEYDFLVQRNDTNIKKTTYQIISVLDSIRSAHNVGGMIRNSECFGCHTLYLTGLSPKETNPMVQKTAMGSEKNLDIKYAESAIELITKLKGEGYEVWTVETTNDATLLSSINLRPKKLALIFGHEQFGISFEILKLSDQSIRISLFGQKNSLNVCSSHAITLNHLVNTPIKSIT